MRINLKLLFVLLLSSMLVTAYGQRKKKGKEDEKKDPMSSATFSGLKFRNIGPAFASGRIADFAVNPNDHSEFYVGVACGHVWKTNNAGITFKPIFDNYGSYSIADVEIDPNNTNVVWVGTGEYNSQRAIGYGDGIYRSEDGGQSFKNMGLKKTEHIGRIVIDPRNSHVYVAAQGPLWGAGGERGIYKTTDNGKTWKRILHVSENTGFNDIVFDPRNPDILYASAYQRRRHVFTLINGGPEGGIYKSVDAGETWEQLKSGLPTGDIGRIGLAISPVNPDIVYAIIEAEGDASGFYKTTNRGASWQKVSSQSSNSPQYYHRIYADPKDIDKVFSMDTYTKYTLDGGKTFTNLGLKHRHVDDHALWIDPDNTNHLIIGGDGGIYETYDHGENWKHTSNLPVTQFYRVAVDNSEPFYFVYGGTQDNNSMGGPSRTISSYGVLNDDWFVTNGGDGFFSQIDPENPNIVYAEAQYGWAVRYDKQSGESISIKPQPPKGEAYRWNWNAPLIISPHKNTRLYFAANKLFKSDDRGNSWQVISPDLTRQLDRNKLPVMGKIQSPDAVAKNASTSLFGNIVALDESPFTEGLLYVGTDDGLIQISEDDGKNWTKTSSFPGIPDMTYVSCLYASRHDKNRVYAAFDARKQNDLKPYLLVSNDKGKTWTSITNNLPERGTVYSIIEDTKKKDLLFAGTEFGIYFSIDGGKKWIQLKGDLPAISIRDIKIQDRENDLVLASFGRGFYILDDFSPLREVSKEMIEDSAKIFPVKDAIMFMPTGGKYGQGETYYAAPNPPVAATFTYYLKDDILTKKQIRKKAEKEAKENGASIKYPSMDELIAEDLEEAPYLMFIVKNTEGNVIRRLKAPAKAGVARVNWDFKYPSFFPPNGNSNEFENKSSGMYALPGKYTVELHKVVNGKKNLLVEPQNFNVIPLKNTTLPAKDRKAMVAFHKKVSSLSRAVIGGAKLTESYLTKISLIRKSLFSTSADILPIEKEAIEIEDKLNDLKIKLTGNESISKRNENQPPSISGRINNIVWGVRSSTSEPTQTAKDQYKIAGELFKDVLKALENIDKEIKTLETKLEELGSPWTPGRLPKWNDK